MARLEPGARHHARRRLGLRRDECSAFAAVPAALNGNAVAGQREQ
ncbi:hypothetical protein Q427_14785 [Halomonas sp. BC04]|nr:hypothetical protein Q427_14785 [Halomonas sp. BC04]